MRGKLSASPSMRRPFSFYLNNICTVELRPQIRKKRSASQERLRPRPDNRHILRNFCLSTNVR